MNAIDHIAEPKKRIAGFLVLVAFVTLIRLGVAQDKSPGVKERIGVYDSRSIAVAFAGSPWHRKQLDELKAEHKKAQEAGDVEKVSRLEAEGKARQVRLHKQGFSTAPVDDLLLCITNTLPEIQKNSGVSVLVSKWDEAGLKRHVGAEFVDVTLSLIDAFRPSDRGRQSAIDVQKHKPISLEDAEQIKD